MTTIQNNQNNQSAQDRESAGAGVSWETFGRVCKEYRERAGMTLEQLAEHVGCTGSAISTYEKGEIDNAYYKFIKRIQMVLGIPESCMPGALNTIAVEWVKLTYTHLVEADGKTYRVDSVRTVANAHPDGKFRNRVFLGETEVPYGTPLFWSIVGALRSYHRDRRAKGLAESPVVEEND